MSTNVRRPPEDDGLFVVGLVGRTGSGKSKVASILASDGAQVIEGDALGHEVTDRDPEVRRALSAEYGEAIYRSDGTLDRPRVAARVFRDSAARTRLDRLVHPRIVAKIRERLEALRQEGYRGVVLIDAALLLEWGLERWCDAVIAVVAPYPEQLRRLQSSRGWTESEAAHRLSAQRSNQAFAAAADATLENTGSPQELEHAAQEIITRLQERNSARGSVTGKEPC